MAQSVSSDSVHGLQEEIECTICLKPFEYPKVVGDCLHTFCLLCLRGHIRGVQPGNKFLCPLCRHPCTVPPGGADGLRTDFKMASIVEKCQAAAESPQRAVSSLTEEKPAPGIDGSGSLPSKFSAVKIADPPPCGSCGNPAVNFCNGCHGVNLCVGCSDAHAVTPFTKDHDLIELCSVHGKPTECFCIDCDVAACCLCLLSVHPAATHRVKSFKDVYTSAKSDIEVALVEASKSQGRLQTSEKSMAAFYCQVLRKRDKDTQDWSRTMSETTHRFKTQLKDVRLEIDSVKKRLDALLQQERDLVSAKGHYETESARHTEESARRWDLTLKDVKSSITDLERLNAELKDVVKNGYSVKKVEGLNSRNLKCLRQTVRGLRTGNFNAEQRTSVAEKIQLSLRAKLDIYRFHRLHASSVNVKHGTVAERLTWSGDWAMVFTDRPLVDGEMLEVMVTCYDETRPDWGAGFGVSRIPPERLFQSPDETGKSSYHGGWDCDGSWTVCRDVLRCGSRQTGTYNFSTLRIKNTTRIGLVRKVDGSVNFVINGTDYGTAFYGVPTGVYGYFCLDGRLAELTMM